MSARWRHKAHFSRQNAPAIFQPMSR
jgi:hypothetical protein